MCALGQEKEVSGKHETVDLGSVFWDGKTELRSTQYLLFRPDFCDKPVLATLSYSSARFQGCVSHEEVRPFSQPNRHVILRHPPWSARAQPAGKPPGEGSTNDAKLSRKSHDPQRNPASTSLIRRPPSTSRSTTRSFPHHPRGLDLPLASYSAAPTVLPGQLRRSNGSPTSGLGQGSSPRSSLSRSLVKLTRTSSPGTTSTAPMTTPTCSRLVRTSTPSRPSSPAPQ